MIPYVVELFAGTMSGTLGFMELGIPSIGFDLEYCDHHGPTHPLGQRVIQDVLTLHGSQFKDALFIWASPPCQEFSCTGLPFKQFRGLIPKTDLFDACFRIQREAEAAAGHQIPMIVENVVSAQKWVGRAAWKYGSFCLWGDVPALMPTRLPSEGRKLSGNNSPRKWSDRRIQRLADGYKADGAFYMKGSGSSARKASSALIARIPPVLARHIASVYSPAPDHFEG